MTRDSPSSITRSSTNNSQPTPSLPLTLPLVLPLQDVFENVPEELQSDIFKSKSRSVKQFQNVFLLVHLFQGGGLFMTESTVGGIDDFLEV
jgi:hypothetical protein